MNEVISRGIEEFATDNINIVYARCYFQLVEEQTAIIYENNEAGFRIKLSVMKEEDSNMMITDMATDETTGVFVTDNGIVCEDDNIDAAMCQLIVGRYLSLMDSFVQFAKSDD